MATALNVNGNLSDDDLKRYAEQLSRIAKLAGKTGNAADYTIQQGSAASATQKPDLSTLGDPAVCYAIYLAAIAAGVPEYIAAAAYNVCLSV